MLYLPKYGGKGGGKFWKKVGYEKTEFLELYKKLI
jgi:hypothetical protein